MKEQILALVTLVSAFVLPVAQSEGGLLSPIPANQDVILAEHNLDLSNRSEDAKVNEIFADNILLALHYFAGDGQKVKGDWEKVQEPFEFSFNLQPGETFAFHDSLLPEFRDLPVKTGGTNYSGQDGYKITGGLWGNGVCHLASLINWTASEAGLEVTAKVNHNFMAIPDVPRKFGASIRSLPKSANSQNQNLYIKNNFDFSVEFVFSADNEAVGLKITK